MEAPRALSQPGVVALPCCLCWEEQWWMGRPQSAPCEIDIWHLRMTFAHLNVGQCTIWSVLFSQAKCHVTFAFKDMLKSASNVMTHTKTWNVGMRLGVWIILYNFTPFCHLLQSATILAEFCLIIWHVRADISYSCLACLPWYLNRNLTRKKNSKTN